MLILLGTAARTKMVRVVTTTTTILLLTTRDAWLKVVNRFCTSAFIRQRLDKTPEELLEMICILPKKDGAEGGRLAVYEESLSLLLFEH